MWRTGENLEQASASENSSGGELRVALSGQPPTLDPPMGSLILTRDTSRLMFETLVTPNAQYEAVPMLAESVETSDDSMTYTFHLRKGVKFHNGEEMTAEDVVASMYRWLEKSTTTGNIFNGATFEAEDDYTVVLQLTQPSSLTLDTLAAMPDVLGVGQHHAYELSEVVLARSLGMLERRALRGARRREVGRVGSGMGLRQVNIGEIALIAPGPPPCMSTVGSMPKNHIRARMMRIPTIPMPPLRPEPPPLGSSRRRRATRTGSHLRRADPLHSRSLCRRASACKAILEELRPGGRNFDHCA